MLLLLLGRTSTAAAPDVCVDTTHALHPLQALVQFWSGFGLKHGHEHTDFAVEIGDAIAVSSHLFRCVAREEGTR